MPRTHHQTVRLRHTDAAGVIYYPRLFEMTHEAYESLLDELGNSLAGAIDSRDPIAPIVRCEADYRRPMTLGMKVAIEISVEREGQSSFTLGYVFRGEGGEELARAQVTHAAIEREHGRSVPLTEGMKKGLAVLR